MSRVKKRWEDEQILHIGRRTPHTDFKRKGRDGGYISLNGNWRFLFLKAPEYSPEGFSDADFKDGEWDNLETPSC